MLGMHLVGVMGTAVEPGIDVGDKIIPILALNNLHPVLAGIFIGGPFGCNYVNCGFSAYSYISHNSERFISFII